MGLSLCVERIVFMRSKKKNIDSWWDFVQKRLVGLDEKRKYDMFWRELTFNETGLLTFDYVLENLDKP